jgi:hypothetical protein
MIPRSWFGALPELPWVVRWRFFGLSGCAESPVVCVAWLRKGFNVAKTYFRVTYRRWPAWNGEYSDDPAAESHLVVQPSPP